MDEAEKLEEKIPEEKKIEEVSITEEKIPELLEEEKEEEAKVMEDVMCPSCGVLNSPYAFLCYSCGRKIRGI